MRPSKSKIRKLFLKPGSNYYHPGFPGTQYLDQADLPEC